MNLNQLTNSAVRGMQIKGHLDEIGTVTVGGNAVVVDHTTTNFEGFANVSAGTNTVAIVATDHSGDSKTNNYQIIVSIGSEAKTLKNSANGSLTNELVRANHSTRDAMIFNAGTASRLRTLLKKTKQSSPTSN